MPNNRNIMFLIVGALCAVVAILAYKAYEDNQKPKGGVQINLGPAGITVDKK
jgi:hypothetical protein